MLVSLHVIARRYGKLAYCLCLQHLIDVHTSSIDSPYDDVKVAIPHMPEDATEVSSRFKGLPQRVNDLQDRGQNQYDVTNNFYREAEDADADGEDDGARSTAGGAASTRKGTPPGRIRAKRRRIMPPSAAAAEDDG